MKRWEKRKPQRSYSELDGIVEKLAAINGIGDVERFTNPTEKELHDPYLLKNIEKARDRLIQAIRNDEKIAIHSDIDADGVTATAIMYRYIKNFNDNVTYFHAQRSMGHGIHNSINDIPDEISLLIILDSSSNQVEACREIFKKGIDIIIIDHHQIERKNKYCILINPQQKGCQYPNKEASGSLLTWKMCKVLDDAFGINYADELIDLAGLGLYSDQMSLLEYENRYVVKQMLDNISNPGLKAILKLCGKDLNNLTASDIGYSAMPFVNAATRFDKIELVLELLTNDDEIVIEQIAQEIKLLNDERKEKQREAVKKIIPKINPDDKCIVVLEPSLGKGFNGLIAHELASLYQRPVIVLGESEESPDEYHGSFRSLGSFDFFEFLKKVPEALFVGGHRQAGGTGCKKYDLDKFIRSINERLANEEFEQVIYYDLELDIEEITEELIEQVKWLYRISGKNVHEPKFLIKNLFVLDKKILGAGDTLKVELCPTSDTWFIDEKLLSSSITGMIFRANEKVIEEFPINKSIDVVGTLNINEYMKWRPKPELIRAKQIFIEDYKLSDVNIE